MKVSWMMLPGSSVCRTACHRLLDGGDAVLRTDDGSDRDQPGSDPDEQYSDVFPSRKLNDVFILALSS